MKNLDDAILEILTKWKEDNGEGSLMPIKNLYKELKNLTKKQNIQFNETEDGFKAHLLLPDYKEWLECQWGIRLKSNEFTCPICNKDIPYSEDFGKIVFVTYKGKKLHMLGCSNCISKEGAQSEEIEEKLIKKLARIEQKNK